MDYFVKHYPNLVSTELIDKSYEGRSIRVPRICKGGICVEYPAMWIDGGMHAREWITSATFTYMMKELVENGQNYPAKIVDQLDWYILPVFNPDGYNYSITSDRMWRKNRYVVD